MRTFWELPRNNTNTHSFSLDASVVQPVCTIQKNYKLKCKFEWFLCGWSCLRANLAQLHIRLLRCVWDSVINEWIVPYISANVVWRCCSQMRRSLCLNASWSIYQKNQFQRSDSWRRTTLNYMLICKDHVTWYMRKTNTMTNLLVMHTYSH